MSSHQPPSLLVRILVVVLPSSIIAVVIVLSVAFTSVYQMLLHEDREELATQLDVLEQSYELGGLQALRSEIERTSVLGRERLYYVRIADAHNRTLIESIPVQWQSVRFEELRNIDTGDLGSIHPINTSGVPYTVEIATAESPDETVFQVGMSTQIRDTVLRTALTTAGVTLTPIIIAVAFVVVWRVRRVISPLGRLIGTMQELRTRESVDAHVEIDRGSRELSELTTVFNALMGRVSSLVGNLRTTLDSLAHDVRTPITRIRSRAELSLTKGNDSADQREVLLDILEESELISGVVTRTLEESKAASGILRISPQVTDLTALVTEVVEAYRYLAESRNIDLQVDTPTGAQACIDPMRIRQAISNLVDNALKYSRPGGSVRLFIHHAGAEVTIIVADEAPMIPEEDRDRIWHYRYRAGADADGYGIGLFLVRAIARLHGGEASVTIGARGNEFRLAVPKECDT